MMPADRFSTKPPRDFGRVTPLSDALATAMAITKPVIPVQCCRRKAIGFVAAEPIASPRALPSQRIAMRDGYAVAARDTIGASPYAPAYLSGPLDFFHAGTAIAGRHDAIVPPDAVIVGPVGSEVLQPVFPGSNVRDAGDDLRAGEAILSAGDRVRPDHLALLTLAGIDEVMVRVPGLSFEGAGPLAEMATSLTATAGAAIVAHAAADVTVLFGAPGYAASRTMVDRVLAEGGSLIAHGLAVNPGSSTGILSLPRGDGGTRIVFVVAGRVEDWLAAWLLLVAPCLAALAGASPSRKAESFPIASKIVSALGSADLVMLRCSASVATEWIPLSTGALSWAAIAAATAYFLVPAEREGFPEGTVITGLYL